MNYICTIHAPYIVHDRIILASLLLASCRQDPKPRFVCPTEEVAAAEWANVGQEPVGSIAVFTRLLRDIGNGGSEDGCIDGGDTEGCTL